MSMRAETLEHEVGLDYRLDMLERALDDAAKLTLRDAEPHRYIAALNRVVDAAKRVVEARRR